MTEPGSGDPPASVEVERLRRMPKVELHCHLEGCVRPQTYVELAVAHGIDLPTTDPALVYDYQDMASFMSIFERLSSTLCTRSDFARVTYESLVDAAGANVIYRETFFDPTTHPACSYPDMLVGICEGLAAAEADCGILGRLIPSIYRGHTPADAVAMVEQVVAHPRDEVVGIGIDGDELEGAPRAFVEAYRLAGRAGLQRTAHAGERGCSEEVRDCLDLLDCTRIDHGYGVLQDRRLVDRCRGEGVHFTYAWLSTAYNYHGELADHPFARMRNAGLSMSLGGDDPAMGGTDLAGDFVTVATALRWSSDVLQQQVQQALTAAWCTPAEKRGLRTRLDQQAC